METEDETSLGEPTVVDNPDDARDESTEQKAFVTRSRNPRVQEAFERLNRLLDTFTDSEQYKRFLEFVSRAPRYSFYNVMMIFSQRPDASVVMGYKKWQEFGRHVMRGEHGIDILAPLIRHVPEVDENGEPVLDEEGKPVTKKKVVGFKTVKVFDIRQTDGEPIPVLDERIEGDRHVELRNRLMDVIRNKGIPISYASRQRMRGANGTYLLDERRIRLSEGLSPDQEAKTLIHEYAHALMHADFDDSGNMVIGGPSPDRQQIEVEAESVAYIVASAFGFDTSGYSVSYIHAWSGGDKRKLRASLERITKTAHQIIEEIEAAGARNATASRTSREIMVPGRFQQNGEVVYQNISYWAVKDHVARGGVASIQPMKATINGREVDIRGSLMVGAEYGTELVVRDGKLVVTGARIPIYPEPVDVEIDPQDVDIVTLS